MFSTLSKTEILILSISNLSSANPLNLVESKHLSSGRVKKICRHEIECGSSGGMSLLTLSQRQILDPSKLKEFADDNS